MNTITFFASDVKKIIQCIAEKSREIEKIKKIFSQNGLIYKVQHIDDSSETPNTCDVKKIKKTIKKFETKKLILFLFLKRYTKQGRGLNRILRKIAPRQFVILNENWWYLATD